MRKAIHPVKPLSLDGRSVHLEAADSVLIRVLAPGICREMTHATTGSTPSESPIAAWLLLALSLSLLACHQPAPAMTAIGATGPSVYAITHVTLIDPDAGARPDITIVIDGDRIRQVGSSATTAIPSGAAVHDASGQFAIAGLWDAHVHVSQMTVDSIPLLIASGVTGVRDMGSDLADIARWRAIRRNGGLVPRVFSPGPKLAGVGTPGPDSWVVASADEARAAVDRLRAQGASFIKVHHRLSRAAYDAIADECRKTGMAFAGHAADEVTPLVAIAAGQRTIEHGREMLPCTPAQRTRVRADRKYEHVASLCAAEGTADHILLAMARAGIWLTPTLASWRGMALDAASAAKLDGFRLAPTALTKRWYGDEPSAPPDPLEREILALFGPLAAQAARDGVRLLAGTDIGDPFVVPGFALHDELRLFVEAGVPPLQALRSATIEPARALGVADMLGSIAPGKAADVVLLSADPLADIRNTRQISAVVLGGRWLPATQLGALRSGASLEDAARLRAGAGGE
jgi:imidazolonepropionase-like amidohydrolase